MTRWRDNDTETMGLTRGERIGVSLERIQWRQCAAGMIK